MLVICEWLISLKLEVGCHLFFNEFYTDRQFAKRILLYQQIFCRMDVLLQVCFLNKKCVYFEEQKLLVLLTEMVKQFIIPLNTINLFIWYISFV